MSSRLNRIAEARHLGARLAVELGSEARRARLAAGMTLTRVSVPVGWSRQKAARFEHGRLASIGFADASAYLAAVGMKLSAKAWPLGAALRDVPQLGVTKRFLARCHQIWRPRFEVPLALAGDLRAFDLLLTAKGARVYVEIITRLTDAQAQLRALHLKWRDGAVADGCLVIVLADTAANRLALGPIRDMLRDEFPLDTRAVFAALTDGHAPTANGIAFA